MDAPPGSVPLLDPDGRVVGYLNAALLGPAAPPRLVVVPAAFDVLAVRTGRRGFVVVAQAAITHVSSAGGVVTVHADGARYWRDGSLAATEARLDPRRFLRVDQSRIVNVTRLAELVPHTHQRYRLVLADAARTELVLSRDVGRRLRAALGW